MSNSYKITQEGLEKMNGELSELKDSKRSAAVKRLAAARAMGDLSENSEYTSAREELNLIDARIFEIEEILKHVELINHGQNRSVVQMGDTVEVQVDGNKQTYTIVGELEADVSKGLISDKSPIGKALLGSSLGTSVNVKIPSGETAYKIVNIS